MDRKGSVTIFVVILVLVILGVGVWYFIKSSLSAATPQAPSTQSVARSSSTASISGRQHFSNSYFDFLYPSDWTIRQLKPSFIAISNSDKVVSGVFSADMLSSMQSGTTNWYAAQENLDLPISNQRNITIDGLVFTAYDSTFGQQHTTAMLITKNYFYSLTFYPSISDSNLVQIANTLKIEQQ